MAFENFALKSWLRNVGNARRKIIFKKLKKDLEERGLTQQEVYKGLLQLIVTCPCVRLTRDRTLGYPRRRPAATSEIKDRHESSSSKNIESKTIDLSSPAMPSKSATHRHRCEPGDTKRLKIDDDSTAVKIPELLDERVGNGSPLLVRIQRNAITLNLTSFSPASAKKDPLQVRPSPEIRLADSSVPDVTPMVDKVSEEKRDSRRVMKKPKIIEDVTCLDGTMFVRSAAKKYSENATKKSKRKKSPEIRATTEETKTIISPTKRVRLRKKLRKMFGNDMTLSESDEEKRLIAEKLMPRKRRKESRMSSDSGVCMNDVASDLNLSEIQERGEEQNRLNKFSSADAKKNKLSEPLVRSMPLLDSAVSDKCEDETHGEALPDSSTNLDEKIMELMPVSSSTEQVTTSTTSSSLVAETIKEEKCFEDRDNLVGMDITKGCQINTQDNQINIQEDIPSPDTENDDENRLIIDESSITGESETSQSLKDCRAPNNSEPKISDSSEKTNEKALVEENSNKNELTRSNIVDANSASELSAISGESHNETEGSSKNLSATTEKADAIVADALFEKIPSNTIEMNSVREPNVVVQSHQVNATEILEHSALRPQSNNRSEEIALVGTEAPESLLPTCVAELQKAKEIPKAPKFRVLHPSELGARWCPTPVDTNVAQSQPQLPPYTSNPQLVSNPLAPQQPSYSVIPQLPSQPSNLQLPPYCFIPQLNSYVPMTKLPPSYSSIPQPTSANILQNPQTNPLEQFLVSNAAPSTFEAGVSTHPNSSSSRLQQAAPPSAYVPRDQYDVTNQNISEHLTTSSTPNTANSSLMSPRSMTASSIMFAILEYLLDLNSCIDRIKMDTMMYDVFQMHIDFSDKKSKLVTELWKYAAIIGTQNVRIIATQILKYYELLMPPGMRILNMRKILYIFQLNQLPPSNYQSPATSVPILVQNTASKPPPYRPARPTPLPPPPPLRNSVFTDSQRRRLNEQIAAYQELSNVLHYQLLVQRGIPTAKPKTTRKKCQKKPNSVQTPMYQVPIVQIPINAPPVLPANLAEQNALQSTVAASVDHQLSIQRVIEDRIRMICETPIVINTVPDISTKDNVAQTISERIPLHPAEKSGQNAVADKNVQDQTAKPHDNDQIIARAVQEKTAEKSVQDQTIVRNVQDQTIVRNVQVQTTTIDVQDKTVKANVNVTPDDITDRENIIEKDIVPIDPLNDTSSSFLTNGHTSVIDVLKEFENFDSTTNGRVSTSTKAQTNVEDAASTEEEKCSKATNLTYPENSKSFPTTLADSAESIDGETTESEKQDIPRDSAITEDVETNVESSREVSVITIEDDYDYAGSCDLPATASDVVKIEEFSILEVKSISRDVFNSMGEIVDVTTPVEHMEDAPADKGESEKEFDAVAMPNCFLCGRQSSVVCEQCRSAFYCSPQCHQEHWESTHYMDCEPAAQESSQVEETLADDH